MLINWKAVRHLLILVISVGISIKFGVIFFRGDEFLFYLAISTMILAIFFGHLSTIIESFGRDNKSKKPLLNVLAFCFLLTLILAYKNGFEALTKWGVMKPVLVEEILFRSLILGMALRIDQIEVKEHRVIGHISLYCVSEGRKNTAAVYIIVLATSVLFSAFHFWDLGNFRSRFLSGVVFSLAYLFAGQKVYPSIIVHYLNNAYAP